MIPTITDKIMGEASDWQNRMLDKVYPIVYLDTIHYKVCEDNKVITKAAYICLGIGMEDHKDILGIWIGESEGAKFWLSVCNDLKNRGVEDVLIDSLEK
jgi:putative transposase